MPKGEISTTAIVYNALQSGKTVYVPYTYRLSSPQEHSPSQIMDMVRLESEKDFQSLEPDRWGIPTPSSESIGKRKNCFGGWGRSDGKDEADESDAHLDLIIMPGMAFDKQLERLGHGKGYYDFFLQRYQSHSAKLKLPMPFLGEEKSLSDCIRQKLITDARC